MKTVLSESETHLHDYIKAVGKVTIKNIETDLGNKIVGCLGRLLKEELIEKFKIKEGEEYSKKAVVYYKIKEENVA